MRIDLIGAVNKAHSKNIKKKSNNPNNKSGFFSLITGSYKTNTLSNEGFIEEKEYEKGFKEHYRQHLLPHVSKFEKKRQKALAKASKRARISTPIVIVATPLLTFLGAVLSTDGDLAILGLIAPSAIAWLLINMSIWEYKDSIKEKIFPNIISFLGDYKYSPECPKKMKKYKESDIVPRYDRESSEDNIKGEYKSVKINLFETELERESRDSKGRRSYTTVFEGIVIHLSMNKNFSGKTIVVKDSGRIGNWFKDKFSKMENVKLEDPKFEKLFEVYSTDQIESRYLLTTSFMERLLKLVELFQGDKIECSFYDNSLLMMIKSNKEYFEAGCIYEPEDFVDDSKQLLEEMNTLFSIIDILKLDQDIGM